MPLLGMPLVVGDAPQCTDLRLYHSAGAGIRNAVCGMAPCMAAAVLSSWQLGDLRCETVSSQLAAAADSLLHQVTCSSQEAEGAAAAAGTAGTATAACTVPPLLLLC